MLYTSYKQERLFTNRQHAIDDSRKQSKIEFVNTVAKINYIQDYPYDDPCAELVPVKHDEIVAAYEKYIVDRGTVYELKATKLKSF